MKIFYILLITLLTFTYSNAQIVDIPDANFKDALVNYPVAEIGNAIWEDVDTNDDGEIQESEAEAVIQLYVGSRNIFSVEGLQSFVNLINLNCDYNNLSSLDISQNLSLETVNCIVNDLSVLNIGQNQNLVELNCDNNNLSAIDVSQNPNLVEFLCTSNNLSTIDVSQNQNLVKLVCISNQITDIDLSQNQNLEWLEIYQNQLSNIDISQNPNLEIFSCFENPINELDVSQNPNLVFLFCSNTQITNLDLSQNPNLLKVNCSNNQLKNLNLKNGNNVNLDMVLANENPTLFCINVDDVIYSSNQFCDLTPPFFNGWCKDEWAEYSEECELGVEENNFSDFNLFPNPVQDVLNIETLQQIEAVKIYSLQRQLIKEGFSRSVDVSNLTTGLYFVQITIDGKRTTKKFIKE